MATQIYLGYPPEHIKKWIKEEAERKYQEMLKTPLTFTAEEAGSTIKMCGHNIGPYLAPTVYLETSTTGEEGSWSDFIVDSTTITLTNVGDKVYFRAKQDNERFGTRPVSYNYFVMTGKISASGNLNTLLKADGSVLDLTGRDCCYFSVFEDCTSLTKAPELPATTLAEGCYSEMFQNCSSLTKAPELPATTLADNCYTCMFQTCKSPFTFPDKTFDEVANLIQNQSIIGSSWYYYDEEDNEVIINPIEIICLDKTMIATAEFEYNEEYDYNAFVGWTLTEK